ncbi:MAG: hypothetical protein U0U66_05160 [Cytophagaceae bacterium]
MKKSNVDTIPVVKGVVLIYNDPNRLPHNIYYFTIFNFSLMNQNAIGPFGFDLKYSRILNPNNIMEVSLNLQPLDFRFLLSPSDDKKYPNISTGLIGTHFFKTWKKQFYKDLPYDYFYTGRIITHKSTNITNTGYNYLSEQEIKLKTERSSLDKLFKLGFRYGVNIQQSSTIYTEIEYQDQSIFNVYGQRSLYLNLGICLSKWMNYEFKGVPSRIGVENYKYLGMMYLDVLYAPMIDVLGESIRYMPKRIEYTTLPNSDKNLLPVHYLGGRIGGKLLVSGVFSIRRHINGKNPIKGKSLGGYMGYELSYYPGVHLNNFMVTAYWGLSFWGKPSK